MNAWHLPKLNIKLLGSVGLQWGCDTLKFESA